MRKRFLCLAVGVVVLTAFFLDVSTLGSPPSVALAVVDFHRSWQLLETPTRDEAEEETQETMEEGDEEEEREREEEGEDTGEEEQARLKGRDVLNKMKVLCWVLMCPSKHNESAVHVKATWGRRCDKLIFMSTKDDPELGAVDLHVPEGFYKLWLKTRAAFKYLYDHHLREYDWFLKADDDTYVVVDNLRYMLSPYDPSQPIAMGCRLKGNVPGKGYLTGGAGYVMSREAVRRVVERGIDADKCPLKHRSRRPAEDAAAARCMVASGVRFGDSRDHLRRARFSQLSAATLLMGKDKKQHLYKPIKGLGCCSPTAVTFHKVTVSDLYLMDYLLYTMVVAGRHSSAPFPPPPPPDRSRLTPEDIERFGQTPAK
ncbi:glycoprotein-N-acetylgalactosamine 3-beta-galactosyltransferase 1-like isoform X1 [Penaeus chinensis]|uniref:glycoprotein-N-acetylgalactosamine 3-beta-galactosyltransferase 1-like isoform X1 n=1 Tax=Penaeus chinensis TaxID=139456 RepID=UPI001FB736AD|nr:glycoprotein-N-acetylgalactosamine 3-beta-galactosyltransferase 1-like isoform X1 [Penaeus chinensis]